MEWQQLLSEKRSRGRKTPYKSNDLRSEFEKDYHRIIGSASFRRLQDKTQVFPLDKSDFIRTRLTHSLEVSSFGKSLGQNIGENILKYNLDPGFTPRMKEDICHILQCAGLIHDIGNPPFGHFGETAIREWFQKRIPKMHYNGQALEEILTPWMKEDFYHFEGNAQALRLVSKLHFLVDEYGMNLTYALLNTIVKYPVSSLGINQSSGDIKEKKMGYYYADQALFEEISKETGTLGRRHPLTYILEAADDIAYKTADIEDAFVKGFISYYRLCEALQTIPRKEGEAHPIEMLQRQYEHGKEHEVKDPETYAVKNWIIRMQSLLINCATYGFTSNYKAIMEGEYKYDLFHGTFAETVMEVLGRLAYEEVFCSPEIFKMEVTESVIINFLMDNLAEAFLYYDTDKKMSSRAERLEALVSDNYKNAYHHQAEGKGEAEKLYLRFLLVTDYICGMTDSYAKRLYQELNAVI